MSSILDKIVARKEQEILALPAGPVTTESLRQAVERRSEPRRNFLAALHSPRRGKTGLIAEVKKASPSKGLIRANFDPVAIAREYEAAGADCLSVLTDVDFFQGSLDYLTQIRAAVKLPLLRKDFIIDERQILEAIDYGADAILLIVAILDDARLQRFHALATAAGLAALVEVHDAEEMDRAIAIAAPLIGVNNRNLRDFSVDLGTTARLSERCRKRLPGSLLVAESGIHARTDVEMVAAAGAGAILVGESLMRERDIGAKVTELLGRPLAPRPTNS